MLRTFLSFSLSADDGKVAEDAKESDGAECVVFGSRYKYGKRGAMNSPTLRPFYLETKAFGLSPSAQAGGTPLVFPQDFLSSFLKTFSYLPLKTRPNSHNTVGASPSAPKNAGERTKD